MHRLQLMQLKQLQQQHEEAVQQSANLLQQLANVHVAMQQQHGLVQQMEGSLKEGVLKSADYTNPCMASVCKANAFATYQCWYTQLIQISKLCPH